MLFAAWRSHFFPTTEYGAIAIEIETRAEAKERFVGTNELYLDHTTRIYSIVHTTSFCTTEFYGWRKSQRVRARMTHAVGEMRPRGELRCFFSGEILKKTNMCQLAGQSSMNMPSPSFRVCLILLQNQTPCKFTVLHPRRHHCHYVASFTSFSG